MTIYGLRMRIMLAFAIATGLLAGTTAIAQGGGADNPGTIAGRPSPLVDSLQKGAQWQNHGVAYAIVPEIRAVLTASKDETPMAALARQGVTDGAVVERKGGFVLYRQTAARSLLSASGDTAPLTAVAADPRPVVLNMRTGQLAVVLNSIRTELRDTTAAGAVATEMGLTVVKQFSNRPVVYYSVPEGTDLIALVGRLRGDGRVANADLELVEFARTLY